MIVNDDTATLPPTVMDTEFKFKSAPDVPTVPKDCQEWNALLHLQNVRSCDPPPTQ